MTSAPIEVKPIIMQKLASEMPDFSSPLSKGQRGSIDTLVNNRQDSNLINVSKNGNTQEKSKQGTDRTQGTVSNMSQGMEKQQKLLIIEKNDTAEFLGSQNNTSNK